MLYKLFFNYETADAFSFCKKTSYRSLSHFMLHKQVSYYFYAFSEAPSIINENLKSVTVLFYVGPLQLGVCQTAQ
jgi:hypothetical protein